MCRLSHPYLGSDVSPLLRRGLCRWVQNHIPGRYAPSPPAHLAEATALLRAGQIKLSSLVTHRFPLEAYKAYEEAYQVLRDSSAASRGKVILDVSAP